MQPTLSFTLATAQTVAVLLSEPSEVNVLAQIAAARGAAEAAAAIEADRLARTYHLGPAPTEGRGYDDRLTMRMGFGQTKLRELLETYRASGGKRGGLRHKRSGTKYVVTEEDVRNYFRQ